MNTKVLLAGASAGTFAAVTDEDIDKVITSLHNSELGTSSQQLRNVEIAVAAFGHFFMNKLACGSDQSYEGIYAQATETDGKIETSIFIVAEVFKRSKGSAMTHISSASEAWYSFVESHKDVIGFDSIQFTAMSPDRFAERSKEMTNHVASDFRC